MHIKVQSLISSLEKRLHTMYECPMVCNQYAWWILEGITDKSRTEILGHELLDLSEQQRNKLDDWVKKLVDQHMPLAYLLGSVPFDNVTVLVDPPILIPRPETEEWVMKLIDELKWSGDNKLTILDLCTGSGCIALALAHHLPHATIVAVDINTQAVELTKKNCEYNKIKNINVVHSDLYATIPKHYSFDLIVSNPPYIDQNDWLNLNSSVRDWEDKNALVAGHGGMAIIEQIIDGALNCLKSNTALEAADVPQLIFEIDCNQGKRVLDKLVDAGYCNCSIDRDIEGKDRVARGRRVPCGHLE